MLLKDTEPFIRFADEVEYTVERDFAKTYDARMIFVLGGSGEFRLDRQVCPLPEGALLGFPPGTPYRFRPDPSFRAVAVDYDLSWRYEAETAFFPPIPLDSFSPALAHENPCPEDAPFLSEPFFFENADYIRQKIAELREEFNSGKLYAREKASLILKNIFFELARSSRSGKTNQICDFVTGYLLSHYQSGPSNSEIAEKLNLDPGYLNKLFKKQTGKTIHRALVEQRINAASKLLISTNLPLERIAAETGFYNSAHFSSLFRRFTGHSPSYYRKGR